MTDTMHPPLKRLKTVDELLEHFIQRGLPDQEGGYARLKRLKALQNAEAERTAYKIARNLVAEAEYIKLKQDIEKREAEQAGYTFDILTDVIGVKIDRPTYDLLETLMHEAWQQKRKNLRAAFRRNMSGEWPTEDPKPDSVPVRKSVPLRKGPLQH